MQFYVNEVKLFIPDFMFASLKDANLCTLTLKRLTSPKALLLIPKESPCKFIELEIICVHPNLDPDDLEEIVYGLKELYRHICRQHVKPEYFKKYFH